MRSVGEKFGFNCGRITVRHIVKVVRLKFTVNTEKENPQLGNAGTPGSTHERETRVESGGEVLGGSVGHMDQSRNIRTR